MENQRVQPWEKVQPHVIHLPPNDVSVPKAWITRILFWALDDASTFPQSYDNLRQGLSRLVVDIPPLLGVLERGASGHFRDLDITIRDDSAIEFSWEDLTSNKTIPDYATLLRAGFPLTGLCDALLPKPLLTLVTDGSPILIARLSKIKGGVVLAYGVLHVATDGWALSELERLWAQHTTDVSQGIEFKRLKPAGLDKEVRQRFRDATRVATDGHIDASFEVIPAVSPFICLYRNAAEAAAAGRKAIGRIMNMMVDAGVHPETRYAHIWRFPADKLALLKTDASSSNPEEWISTMDALTGLFWSRIAHIQRQSTRSPKQTTTCLFFLNARSRWQPPIPISYTGNVIAPVSTECSLAALESSSTSGLRLAAQTIRKANNNWDTSHAQAMCNKIKSLPPSQALYLRRDIILGKHNLIFNDYSKFNTNNNDWGGSLGLIRCTRIPGPLMPGGVHGVVVYPRFPDGSLEVTLGCTENLRVALDRDAVFAKYAEFICSSVPHGNSTMKSIITQIVFVLYSTGRTTWRLFAASARKFTSWAVVVALAICSVVVRKRGKVGGKTL